MQLDLTVLSTSKSLSPTEKELVADWLTNGHRTLIELYVTTDSELQAMSYYEDLKFAVDRLPRQLSGAALHVIGSMRMKRRQLERQLREDTDRLELLARQVSRLKLTPFERFERTLRWGFKRTFAYRRRWAHLRPWV